VKHKCTFITGARLELTRFVNNGGLNEQRNYKQGANPDGDSPGYKHSNTPSGFMATRLQ